MVKACVLIKSVPPKVEKTLEQVRAMGEVRKAYIVFGRWDIVAFIEAPNYERLRDAASRINSLEGVRSTETLVEA